MYRVNTSQKSQPGQVEYPRINKCNICHDNHAIAWCDTCIKKICSSCKECHTSGHNVTLYNFANDEFIKQNSGHMKAPSDESDVRALKQKPYKKLDIRRFDSFSATSKEDVHLKIQKQKDGVNRQCEKNVEKKLTNDPVKAPSDESDVGGLKQKPHKKLEIRRIDSNSETSKEDVHHKIQNKKNEVNQQSEETFADDEYVEQLTNGHLEAPPGESDVGGQEQKPYKKLEIRQIDSNSETSKEDLYYKIEKKKDEVNNQCEETLKMINGRFNKLIDVLQKRKESLRDEVSKTRLKIHNVIDDEYETTKKQTMTTHQQLVRSQSRSRSPFVTTDYIINWNSECFDDFTNEVNNIAGSINFCSFVPSLTELKGCTAAVVGKLCKLQLKTFDRDRNVCKFGGIKFTAEVHTPTTESHKCKIIDNHNGTYTICFLPLNVGEHTIKVRVPYTRLSDTTHTLQGHVDCYDVILISSHAYFGKESQVKFEVVGTKSLDLKKFDIRVHSDETNVVVSTCKFHEMAASVTFTPRSLDPYTLVISDQEEEKVKHFKVPVKECAMRTSFAYVENVVKFGKTPGVKTSIRIASPEDVNMPFELTSVDNKSSLMATFFPESNGIFKIFISERKLKEFVLECKVGSLMVDVRGALVDGTCDVMVYALDCCGFIQKQLDYIPTFSANIKSPDGFSQVCDVSFTGNSWTISFFPTTIGCHTLDIKVNNASFRYSSITVDVSDHLQFDGGPSSEFFGKVSDICVTEDGRIIVADTAQNNRVVLLDAAGRFHSNIQVQTRDVSLITSVDLKLYVLFVLKKVLEVYDVQTHKMLYSVRVTSIASPSALCVNKITNELLVSDTESKCVYVMDPVTGGENRRLSLPEALQWPSDVCFSEKGFMYVCDTDSKVVFRVNMKDSCLDIKRFGDFGEQHPIAVTVDSKNQTLVLLREQEVHVYHNDDTLIEVIQVHGEISRRNKLYVSPDGCCCFIKTNEMENCLRKYRYTSVEKKAACFRRVKKRTRKLERCNANVFNRPSKLLSRFEPNINN
ncbi:uncharacterized protein [Antedon mediterranea]|uniref:uncharacterized protein n=1 Tax=Antedon mediterranea TaxID=105859 RepID=UPI003AF996E8